jgi:hypothetical protein
LRKNLIYRVIKIGEVENEHQQKNKRKEREEKWKLHLLPPEMSCSGSPCHLDMQTASEVMLPHVLGIPFGCCGS